MTTRQAALKRVPGENLSVIMIIMPNSFHVNRLYILCVCSKNKQSEKIKDGLIGLNIIILQSGLVLPRSVQSGLVLPRPLGNSLF